VAEKRRDNGVSGRRGSGRIPKALCGRNEKTGQIFDCPTCEICGVCRSWRYEMHALYEEKKDFYNWQVENGSGYLVSVSEKEWENGIELLKNAEKRSGR